MVGMMKIATRYHERSVESEKFLRLGNLNVDCIPPYRLSAIDDRMAREI